MASDQPKRKTAKDDDLRIPLKTPHPDKSTVKLTIEKPHYLLNRASNQPSSSLPLNIDRQPRITKQWSLSSLSQKVGVQTNKQKKRGEQEGTKEDSLSQIRQTKKTAANILREIKK